MFGIGIPEFILILVVGLIVFGPSKLPEIGRAVGKGLREFKKASSAFQNILNAPDDTPARSMAATHGNNTSVNMTAENKVEPETEEAKEAEKPKDVVSISENAHGYTPPTKESVQAEIEKNKNKVK